MARRDNRQAIPIGPAWADVFRSLDAGGTDGPGARELLLTCAADSAVPLEYRVEAPKDPSDEQAELKPGEAVRLVGDSQHIRHVQMRGVGGAATGGVEEIRF
ncbi:MAG: hypothetical protein H6813_02620 [Phycisphaeraceae bacterium]|nr:hypothetical protein [Phycisphaeraceae bacterium]MCB9848790.1 hypothetical protein [Phycisphaeraceae bacterium]